MKAVCWQGRHNVRVETVPDPTILNPRDCIVKVTTSAICGSDLHLYDGRIPSMQKGDVLGHEFMGEVVEVGSAVKRLKPGDRVVAPFAISCGECHYCKRSLFALCDNSNPNAAKAEDLFGQSGAGLFGYSHLFGGYAGGQAEFARVPFADVGLLPVPAELSDEQLLLLGDILPTAWMAAENCGIQPGDTVAIWGCGPVGLLAIQCAYLLGADKVIAIDRHPIRLEMAVRKCRAVALNYEQCNVLEELQLRTGGRGPDSCIDAVGMEAHGSALQEIYGKARAAMHLEVDPGVVLREVVLACRKGGTISIPGVYTGMIDKVPIGAAFTKGLTLKLGQPHVQRYMRPLLNMILDGKLNPSFVITHRFALQDAVQGYHALRDEQDTCVKVVLHS